MCAFADVLIKLRLCPFDLGGTLMVMAAKEVEELEICSVENRLAAYADSILMRALVLCSFQR